MNVFQQSLLAACFVWFLWNFLMSSPSSGGLVATKEHRGNKVVLFTAIFSSDEPYHRFFLESAATSGCDVVVIGDQPPSLHDLPGPNVKHYLISWPDFLENANQRLFDGKPLLNSLRNGPAYKVTEFKPLFAFLFPHLVHNYEWWGHVDNDMVLGTNLPLQLQGYLQTKDIVSVSAEHASVGPFQLYRNTDTINTLFREGFTNPSMIPLQDILTYPKYVGFDEWGQESPWPRDLTSSMSSIIADNKHKLRVQMGDIGIEFVYDGFCHMPEEMLADEEKWSMFDVLYPTRGECALCFFEDGSLYVLDEKKEEQSLVLGCHYQFSKSTLRESLTMHDDAVAKMLERKEFQVSYTSGFQPLPKSF